MEAYIKKEKSNWWVALVLVVISSLIALIPTSLYGGLFYLTGVVKFNLVDTYTNQLLQSTGEVVQIFSIWLGVKYACRYILKKYQLPNRKKVIVLGTLYIFISMVLNFLSGIFIARSQISSLLIFTYIVGDVLACVVFYYSARQYLLEVDVD